MARIIIPPMFYDTRKSTLSIPENMANTFKTRKVESFSNPNNIYILQLKPRSNLLEFYASGALGYLNITGDLEINSTNNIHWNIKHQDMSKIIEGGNGWYSPKFNYADKYVDSLDDWKFKKITINISRPNSELIFKYNGTHSFYDNEDKEKSIENKYLKEICLSANTIGLDLNSNSVEKINIDCEQFYDGCRICGKNIKEINLNKLKQLNVFSTFISRNIEELPLDPTIKINKNCNFLFPMTWRSKTSDDEINHDISQPLIHILEEEKIKTFKNDNNVVEIKLSTLKLAISLYENHLIQFQLKQKELDMVQKLNSKPTLTKEQKIKKSL